MPWTQSPQTLIDLFTDSLPDDPRIERRTMFGCPTMFVNGNMFAGVLQDRIFARLAPADRETLERAHGPTPFEPTPGRPMKAYSVIPDEVVADEGAVAAVLAGSLAFTVAMPPKVKNTNPRRMG